MKKADKPLKPKKKEIVPETAKTQIKMMYPSSVQTVRQYLYIPFILLPDLSDLVSKTIEIRVHKSYLTKFNQAV